MYIFTSLTKVIPTYVNSYFSWISPVQKYIIPWKHDFFLQFFLNKKIFSKSLEKTLSLGSIGHVVQKWFKFKFDLGKNEAHAWMLIAIINTHMTYNP